MITTSILLDNMTFQYEGALKPVFENVTLHLDASWRLGIIGRNGRGKTTLLNILAKHYSPKSGVLKLPEHVTMFPLTVEHKNALTLKVIRELIGPIDQIEAEMEYLTGCTDEKSLIRYGDLMELYEYYQGYNLDTLIKKELYHLNMSPEILSRPYQSLSGGERTKVQIAAMFLKPQHYMLIDEPTNHLDMLGRAELSDYLSHKSGFALVSHDQAFIDDCCDHILAIGKNEITIEKGNYSSWDENRRQFESFELSKKEKLTKETKQLEKAALIARGYSVNKEKQKSGAMDKGFVGARSARLMKRAKSLEKRRSDKLDEARNLLSGYEKVRRLELRQTDIRAQNYLKVHDMSFSYGTKVILNKMSFEINKGDRIWLRGENGAGKSTLLDILNGQITTREGYIHKHSELRISRAYQDMPVLKGLVSDYLEQYKTELTGFVRMLDYFNMDVAYLDRRIETLSEGERKKLDIARALSSDAPLFIWDEPLNYMDYHFRIQLEEAVLKYEPTIIFVEHDRTFAHKIATKMIDIR